MRRRRRGLQVSTFPFLAVLLCAMGSLILLLLVIDRRAKAVSRARAEQAAAHVLAEDVRMTAARQAEWEQRRRELHELLAREEEEVVSKVKAVEGKAAAAATEVETAQARFRALRERLEAEAGRLVRKKDELTARRVSVARAGQKAEASKQELAQLAAELDRLEQTLRDLRALRERDKQTYSLIPFFGRRGDDRRPIYVECTAAGLVFHPDRLVLEGPSLEPMAIRTEVERRIARQREAFSAAAPGVAKTEPSAYLLMLVRPDGIGSYYHTQSALVGLKIEFGYEFVEQDWILDFSADDNAAATQPWMTAGKDRKAPPPRAQLDTPAPRPVPGGAVRGGFMTTGPRGQGEEDRPGRLPAGQGLPWEGRAPDQAGSVLRARARGTAKVLAVQRSCDRNWPAAHPAGRPEQRGPALRREAFWAVPRAVRPSRPWEARGRAAREQARGFLGCAAVRRESYSEGPILDRLASVHRPPAWAMARTDQVGCPDNPRLALAYRGMAMEPVAQGWASLARRREDRLA